MERNLSDTLPSGDPAPASPDQPLPAEVGEIIGGYRLESLLGRGAMGCVYLGTHTLLGRRAAIKVLQTELTGDRAYVSRFFQEARIVNEVRHPNIVDVIDFVNSEEPRRVAYIMEHIAGPTLADALGQRRFSVAQAVNLTRQLAQALGAVHAVGVVHRDLKPANILVTGPLDGDLSSVPSVKIVDFGIAKVQQASGHHTATGMVMGTPAYMAPEQIAADPATGKTDVYALGEIFFEMVGGQRAFSGENMAMFKAKLGGSPSLPKLPPEVPKRAEILNLVLACLEHDPQRRPTIKEMIERLTAIASDLPTESTHGPPLVFVQQESPAPPTISHFTQTPQLPASRRELWVGATIGALAVAGLLIWQLSARPNYQAQPLVVPVQPAPSKEPAPTPPPAPAPEPIKDEPAKALPPPVATPPVRTKGKAVHKKGPLKRELPDW